MSVKDKVCFLAWDEASLDAQIYYCEKEDKIVGLLTTYLSLCSRELIQTGKYL